MSQPNSISETDRTEVVRLARELAYDDYLAALLAPPKHRDDLITFAALKGELARVPLQVSEAALGEIRLQWWRDALSANTRSGHPVADAVVTMQQHFSAPMSDLIAPIIDARAAELYSEPFASEAEFDAYAITPISASFSIRATLLGSTISHADPFVQAAARTLGLVEICARLPYLFAKGRYPIFDHQFHHAVHDETVDAAGLRTGMMDLIATAATAWTGIRPQIRHISPELRNVVLPVALAGPYLRAIQKVGRDVLRDVAEPSPLERSTRLWLAARLGRF